jgi:hypothetical protein
MVHIFMGTIDYILCDCEPIVYVGFFHMAHNFLGSSNHILCDCERIAYVGFGLVGHNFMGPNEHHNAPIRKILHFIRGVVLIEEWTGKGRAIDPRSRSSRFGRILGRPLRNTYMHTYTHTHARARACKALLCHKLAFSVRSVLSAIANNTTPLSLSLIHTRIGVSIVWYMWNNETVLPNEAPRPVNAVYHALNSNRLHEPNRPHLFCYRWSDDVAVTWVCNSGSGMSLPWLFLLPVILLASSRLAGECVPMNCAVFSQLRPLRSARRCRGIFVW